MGTQLSKCQIEQVNKLTEAVTKLTVFLHDDNRLAARSISDPENSNNSGSGDDDEKNDTGLGSPYMKWIVAFTKKLAW